jgi:hypothetical protein
MTSQGRAWLGIGGLVALAGVGWLARPAASTTALVIDNPARRRRAAKRKPRPSLVRQIADCQRSAAREARPQTYKRKAEAVRALLDANPALAELLETDCGRRECADFTAWERRGRRGPKPRAAPGDGRFDPLNERWERRTPGRRVASWREAVTVTAPSSRRWEDFGDRVPVLEEATGFRLALPDRAEAIGRARAAADRCEELRDRPRRGRDDDAIPF